MHNLVQQWIVAILSSNPQIVELALRQRAKCEGWLKFELAAHALANGATDVLLEAPLEDGMRCDMTIQHNGRSHHLELKTPNTNWRMHGVLSRTRPITANIESVVKDAQKLTRTPQGGLVAFVLFPVPRGDLRWQHYINRIGHALGVQLVPGTCATVSSGCGDVIVCCFTENGRDSLD